MIGRLADQRAVGPPGAPDPVRPAISECPLRDQPPARSRELTVHVPAAPDAFGGDQELDFEPVAAVWPVLDAGLDARDGVDGKTCARNARSAGRVLRARHSRDARVALLRLLIPARSVFMSVRQDAPSAHPQGGEHAAGHRHRDHLHGHRVTTPCGTPPQGHRGHRGRGGPGHDADARTNCVTDDETYYVDSQGEQWRIHVDDGPRGETTVKADVPGCSVGLVRHTEREFEAAAAVVEAMVAGG